MSIRKVLTNPQDIQRTTIANTCETIREDSYCVYSFVRSPDATEVCNVSPLHVPDVYKGGSIRFHLY